MTFPEARREAYHDPEQDAYLFRGSFFGGCEHSLVLALQGAQPRPPGRHLQARFAAGTHSEEVIKADMLSAGLASYGPPAGEMGIVWDAGPHYTQQRQVTSQFTVGPHHEGFAYPDGLAWLRNRCGRPAVPLYIVNCSLDGWGLAPQDYAAAAAGANFYDGQCDPAVIHPGLHPFVLEHKSVMVEKKEALDAACLAPYCLSPDMFWDIMPSYSWQISGQVQGVRTMCAQIFEDREGVCYPLDGVSPTVFLSVEVLQKTKDSYLPIGRYLYYMFAPPRTGLDIATRLHKVVGDYKRGHVPTCDSEWGRCDWDNTPPAIITPAKFAATSPERVAAAARGDA